MKEKQSNYTSIFTIMPDGQCYHDEFDENGAQGQNPLELEGIRAALEYVMGLGQRKEESNA